MAVVVCVGVGGVEDDVATGAADALSLIDLKVEGPACVGEFAELGFELFRVDAEGDHGAEVHVSG